MPATPPPLSPAALNENHTPSAPNHSRAASIHSGTEQQTRTPTVVDQIRTSLRRVTRRNYAADAGATKKTKKTNTSNPIPFARQLARTPAPTRPAPITLQRNLAAQPTRTPSPTIPITLQNENPVLNRDEDELEHGMGSQRSSNTSVGEPPVDEPEPIDPWNRQQDLNKELADLKLDREKIQRALEGEVAKLPPGVTTSPDIEEIERHLLLNEQFQNETRLSITEHLQRLRAENERLHNDQRIQHGRRQAQNRQESTLREDLQRRTLAAAATRINNTRQIQQTNAAMDEYRRRTAYDTSKRQAQLDGPQQTSPYSPSRSNTDRDELIACLMTTGTSTEEAQRIAAKFLKPNKESNVQSLLDQNQSQLLQTQAISLLNNLPSFGESSIDIRFENWIRQFNSCTATADFDEFRKILILTSKLTGPAADALQQLQQDYPEDAKSFAKITKVLHKRFHGNETHNHYADAYKRCVRLDGEAVRDYASRTQKLFRLTYPSIIGDKAGILSKEIETMLMDKFIAGLQRELRKRIANKKFKTFDDLIECVEGYVNDEERDTEERRAEAHIRAIGYAPTPQYTEADRRTDALISLMERMLLEKNNPTTNPKVHSGNQGEGRGEKKKFPYNKNDFCNHCDMKGHSDQDCKAKSNVCNKCNNTGHFYNSCPQNPKNTAVSGRPEQRSSQQTNIPSAMPRQQTPEN